MIKRFTIDSARRFRQNSLEELNDAVSAIDQDIDQIVDEIDNIEDSAVSVEFDDVHKGVVFSAVSGQNPAQGGA